MTTVTAGQVTLTNDGYIAAYHRKMKCPRHFILKPGHTGFVMIRDPKLKGISDEACKRFKVNPYIKKRDARGNPVRNNKDYYQPEISASFAIEHVYDPANDICVNKCKGRCLEGKHNVNLRGIKRLNG